LAQNGKDSVSFLFLAKTHWGSSLNIQPDGSGRKNPLRFAGLSDSRGVLNASSDYQKMVKMERKFEPESENFS
jgi:hypothetical protein